MDRQDFDLSQLKQIVLRNSGSSNAVLASYTVAHAHEVRGEYSKATFYAQTALQRSRELGSAEWTAASLNLLANLELHESHFAGAQTLFQEAMDRYAADGKGESREAAVVADNLGYCHIALDAVPVGLPLVRRSLATLESLGYRQAMDYPCLDLCFASLKLERIDEAEGWGVRALELGQEFGRNDVVKNAHYLLAETYSEMGREHAAEEHYEALANYYPNFPALKNYLHQISLMGMINLRA